MSRTALAISPWFGAVASCVITASAVASDLTVKGRASETVELNDNYGLSTPKSGVLGSYSSGSLSALYRTPTTRFTLSGDIVYRKFFGPATESSSFNESLNEGVNMRYERDGKALGDKDYVTASYRSQNAALAQRNAFGFSTTTDKSNLLTYNAGAGTSRRLSDTDVVSLSVNALQTAYSPSSSTGTPFTTYTANGGWSHQATHTIDVHAAQGFGFSKYDNSANTQVVASRTTGGASIHLSDRLTISGNAGVVVLKTTQDTAGPVTIVPVSNDPFATSLFTPAPAIAGTVIGPVFDASLNYRLLKSTTVSFFASQSISQGPLGNIAKQTQFSISANHTVNSISSLSFTASSSQYDAPGASAGAGSGSTIYSGTVSYNYQLAREWFATATYIYRQIQGSSTTTTNSTASSNAVLFVVSKGFTLKP